MPPAIVGYTLERPIERRLGTPPTIAAGLAAGAAAMWIADARSPQRRARTDAGVVDALALGLAQACALVPGVSRNGATLTAARARGFRREDANALSRHVALPVIVGATAAEGRAAGAARSAGRRGGRVRGRDRRGVRARRSGRCGSSAPSSATARSRPYAAYRLALAALVWRRAAR